MSRETGLARNTDPETSHEAAELPVSKLEQLVLDQLASRDMTSWEIANKTGENVNSINPRMRPLADRELIYDTGDRRKALVQHTCSNCGHVDTLRMTKRLIVWGKKK